LGHVEPITSLNISPKTAKYFVSGSEDKNIKIWELNPEQNATSNEKK
jgi:hypothetical protein